MESEEKGIYLCVTPTDNLRLALGHTLYYIS